MPKYLFTSDQRISALPERIQWVAKFIHSGHNVSEIADKSDNNNAATLKFYYNLHSGTETCEKAVADPVFVIRNFVLKFQFPNVRTQESLQNTISERLLLAPYRSVVSLLVALAEITKCNTSAMSMSEILYYVFCNPTVYNNPAVNYKEIAKQILDSREKNEDFENAVGNLLEWNQYGRQSRELINVLTYSSKCFSFSKGILKYSTTHEAYIKDKDFINELITYNKFWYPTDSQNYNLATSEYISYMNTVNTPYSVVEFSPNTVEPKKEVEHKKLQQIFYGAPGTGKSHTINERIEGESVIRTTFHPDSDYSTFVGAYKPTMGLLPICDELGQPMKIGSTVLHKEQIIYEFVDQAFLQAYVQAWKFYAENSNTAKKQYLIIEEINRGNCAQIFGDLFQLLDRNDSGFSVYPINADKDMKKQLAKAFKKDGVTITIPNADKINALYKGKDIVSKVLSGDILVLPNNLYIWATMNTSDQSLFPIDSAFKRRWEWQYMPIGKGYDENGQEIKWAIEGATKEFSWWSFLEEINAQIGEATQSEDKKLGFFFCKATDGVISAEKFVGKVIFYLWNDVFKNNGFEGPIFKDVDGTELSFAKFYKSDMKGNAIVQKDKVELFLNNLGVEVFKDGNIPSEEPEEDEDGNQALSPSTGRDYTKFSINGVGNYAKNNLAAECVKKYIELNPTKTAEEVLNDWRSLGNIVPHFIESKEQYDARTDNSKRSHEIACGGAVIYVAHNGYGNNGKVLVLMDAVNQKDWGITIQKNV